MADAKKNGYLAPITGKAKGARKVVEKVGGRRRAKAKGGKGAKPSGKKKTKKPKAESSCVAASLTKPINPFYNSAADSQSGTLVRGSPDKVKKVLVQKVKQATAEEELAEVTREINERFVKVHHVEGRALAPGEQPEHYEIHIPLRFIR